VTSSKLSGLKCAVYLLDCIIRDESKTEIVRKFDGDEQLVDMWMSFIRHNYWIAQKNGSNHQWVMTEKGRKWARKLLSESIDVRLNLLISKETCDKIMNHMIEKQIEKGELDCSTNGTNETTNKEHGIVCQ
jgi:hypothetical protein